MTHRLVLTPGEPAGIGPDLAVRIAQQAHDVELVKLEQNPNDQGILSSIFRMVHTIKGTCGFLGLPRLEGIAHAAETLMGKFRDGAPVTQEAVSLILTSIDQIKDILGELEAAEGEEPQGDDSELMSWRPTRPAPRITSPV